MSSEKQIIRLGLVGAGRWGRNYINTINKINGVHLARLASQNPQAQTMVGDDCIISNDWRELVEVDDLDGIVLAVPPDIQVEIAVAALKNKIPLLLEKPIATNVADAGLIRDLAEKNNVPALVDHIYLFHPAYEALKREAGKLEHIKSIRSTGGDMGPFREAWSPLWDWGPHDVAMCMDLTNEFPSSISAKREEIKTANGIGEIFNVKLEFPSGINAEICFGNAMAEKTRRLSVMDSGVEIIFDNTVDEKIVRIEGGQSIVIDVSTELSLDRVIKIFTDGLRGGDKTLFGTNVAVKVVQVLAEIERQCKAI